MVGVPSTQLSKLQRLQNAGARLVSKVAKYDHITPTLVNLHWLPVTYRVNLKIAVLAHKCIYGNAPEYLRDLIKVKSTTRYNLRSDGEMLLEDYSARSKKTLGDRTFKVAGLESETFYRRTLGNRTTIILLTNSLRLIILNLYKIFNYT